MDNNRTDKAGIEIKLNLIPPAKKEDLKRNYRLKKVIKAEVVLTCILCTFTATLLSFLYVLNMELTAQAALNKEMEMTNQFDKIKNYDKQFSEANEKIKQMAVIDKAQLYWSNVFIKLSQLILSGITIETFSTKDYQITIAGTSDTRDTLLIFKDNLEKERCFSEIDLPLSSLVNKENVDFQISFKVDKECLKKISN